MAAAATVITVVVLMFYQVVRETTVLVSYTGAMSPISGRRMPGFVPLAIVMTGYYAGATSMVMVSLSGVLKTDI